MAWSPKIYPATMDALARIARKRGMHIERLVNLYLQLAVIQEDLMEKETAYSLLKEEVLVNCITKQANRAFVTPSA